MAYLCMNYLAFDCFTIDFDSVNVRFGVEKGDYGFLEYSLYYWLQHMRSLQATAEQSSTEGTDLLLLSRNLLQSHYQLFLSGTPWDRFSNNAKEEHALWDILAHVQEQVDDIHNIAQEVEYEQQPLPNILRRLLKIRNFVEEASESNTHCSSLIAEAYGPLKFKCPFLQCKQYQQGFRSRKLREKHVKGHERPFKCTEEGCDYQVFGFSSKAALAAHVSSYHDSSCEEYTFPNIRPRSIWKALDDAIDKDDATAVRALCEEAATLPDKQYGFVLRAVIKKSLSASHALIELFADDAKEMNYQDRSRGTALHVIAEDGEEALLRFILETSVDINAISAHGMSPICVAASKGHLGIVQLLLQHSRLRSFYWHSSTIQNMPLQFAAAAGHLKVVRLLLEDNAQWYLKEGHFLRALEAATASGHKTMVKLMLEKGATVNAQEIYDKEMKAAVMEDVNVAVDLLLQRDAQKKKRREIFGKGKTLGISLQEAASRGDEAEVKLLLEMGAKMNDRSAICGSALQAAAGSYQSNEAVVRLLLENGADVNAIGGIYENALQAAASINNEAVVQLLLNSGADVNVTGGYCGSALHAAAYWGSERVMQLLLNSGADVKITGGYYGSALQAAACNGSEAVVQLLLKSGADVNATGGEYDSALQAAAFRGIEAVVQLLLENGADVNAKGGKYGSALKAARKNDHPTEAVVELLEAAIRKTGKDVPTSPS